MRLYLICVKQPHNEHNTVADTAAVNGDDRRPGTLRPLQNGERRSFAASRRGLLRLEADPQDSATLEEVFRAAHSLKGAARMLGVHDVETVAHHFEDALGAAKRGRMILSPQTIDLLYGGLDAIRKLVQEAVTGEAAGVNVERVLAQLNGTEARSLVARSATQRCEERT
jgi:chemotaxis protein histidine kinase CheA